MHPHLLLPSYLFKRDPETLWVYAYCLHKTNPALSKVPIGKRIVKVMPNEAVIEKPLGSEIQFSETEFHHHLQNLEQLDLVQLTIHDDYLHIRFPYLAVEEIRRVATVDSRSQKVETSFQVFSEEYLEHVRANLAPRTLENAERVIKFANRSFGNVLLSNLRAKDLEAYKGRRREEDGVAITTVNIDLHTLKAALRLAVVWGYLDVHPFRDVRAIPNPGGREVLYIPDEEFVELLGTVENETYKDMFKLDYLTGLRLGELVCLPWEQIDFDEGIIHVKSSQNYRVKHGKNRRVPITEPVRHILQRNRMNDPLVFMNNERKPYNLDFISKQFKSAVRRAGLNDKYCFHCLRKTCATNLLHHGASMMQIRDILGHVNVKTTEAYVGIPTKDIREAMERLTLPPLP